MSARGQGAQLRPRRLLPCPWCQPARALGPSWASLTTRPAPCPSSSCPLCGPGPDKRSSVRLGQAGGQGRPLPSTPSLCPSPGGSQPTAGSQGPRPGSPGPGPIGARPRSPRKDTVLVALAVAGWPRHVEQDQLGVLGLLDDDLVELHGRVHPPHVGLVPVGQSRCAGAGARPGLAAPAPGTRPMPYRAAPAPWVAAPGGPQLFPGPGAPTPA